MKVVTKIPEEQHNYGKQSHLLEFLWLVLGVLALVFGVYIVSGWLVGFFVHFIPQETERKLFAKLTQALAPESDRVLSAELQGLLDRLVRATPEIEIPISVRVIEGDAPNAMALPGGVILVTKKLLQKAGSQNEIMMVLAHELGHFRLRHHLRGLGRGVILLGTMIVLGGEPEASSFISPSSQLVSRSFSRADEAAADEYALETLDRAVGHVGGATDFFEKIATMELGLPGMSYLSTHPPSSDRVRALRAMIAQRGYRELALDPKPRSLPN